MRAISTLISKLFENLPSIHKARRNSLSFAVESLCHGAKLGLTSIGRSAFSKTTAKHNIKRVDCLLGNTKVFHEIPQLFEAVINMIIQPNSSPLILVDWTLIGNDHCALFASVPYEGRAITVYFEVHPLEKYSNRNLEYAFLDQLKNLLPDGVKPTLITDAGYLNPWFKKVMELDWYFIGRLNPRMKVLTESGKRTTVKQLESFTKTTATDIGRCLMTITNPLNYRVIQGKRIKRNPNRRPEPRLFSGPARGSRQARRRAFTPWVLGTNHEKLSAEEIMSFYALRMSIEEQFRDFKNARYGWAFREVRASSITRYSILLLIGSIAQFIMMMIGKIAEQQKVHLQFSSRSNPRQRVLSLFFLARELLRLNYDYKVTAKELNCALNHLNHYFMLERKTGDT